MTMPQIGNKGISSLAIIMLCNLSAAMAFGLLQPVLTIRMEQAGQSSAMMGVVVSAWSLAIIVGGPFYPKIIYKLGVKPSLVSGLALTGTLILLFPFSNNPFVWASFQFLLGLAFGHFWVVSEAWLNTLAKGERRGLTTSLYVVSLAIGGSIGPLLINLVGYEGFAPFILCSAILILGATPLFFLASPPSLNEEEPPRFRLIIAAFPMILVLGLVAGFTDQAPTGLLPAYILKAGFDVTFVTLALFAVGLGKLLFVIPIGLLADYASPRLALVLSSSLCIALVLALPATHGHPYYLLTILFLFGALLDAFYALSLAQLGTSYRGVELASANTVFVMLHSFGSFGGSLGLGLSMDTFGTNGYSLFIAMIVVLLPIGYVLLRQR